MRPESYSLAYEYTAERLEHELLPCLYYHNFRHTLSDVLENAAQLAEASHVTQPEHFLLLTGALFHDMGWVDVQERTPAGYAVAANHEDRGAALAAQILPNFGYDPDEIAHVQRIVMATKLPQNTPGLLEQIIADADLDSIAREDFWLTSFALREEQAAFGIFIPEARWYAQQARFLRSQTFFTTVQRQRRDAGRLQNIAQLEERLRWVGATA